MNFAYADPPYLGRAKAHYGKLHPQASDCQKVEWHANLISLLCTDYPDGWALSASASSLKRILALCPDDVRVGAWTKPDAVFKKNVNPAYSWEPVIWRGGRKHDVSDSFILDFHHSPLKRGFPGAKPESFVLWILRLLNARRTDTIDDLFPGSGAVTDAINAWRRQQPLWDESLALADSQMEMIPAD